MKETMNRRSVLACGLAIFTGVGTAKAVSRDSKAVKPLTMQQRLAALWRQSGKHGWTGPRLTMTVSPGGHNDETLIHWYISMSLSRGRSVDASSTISADDALAKLKEKLTKISIA